MKLAAVRGLEDAPMLAGSLVRHPPGTTVTEPRAAFPHPMEKNVLVKYVPSHFIVFVENILCRIVGGCKKKKKKLLDHIDKVFLKS